jgi:hypothetical protein
MWPPLTVVTHEADRRLAPARPELGVAAGIATLVVVLVAVIAGSPLLAVVLPPVGATLLLARLGGWAWLEDRVVAEVRRLWPGRLADRAPRAPHRTTRQVVRRRGEPSRELVFRGGDPSFAPGDLVQVLALGGRRRRRVLWARHLATGRRWVSSALVWWVVWASIAVLGTAVWSTV